TRKRRTSLLAHEARLAETQRAHALRGRFHGLGGQRADAQAPDRPAGRIARFQARAGDAGGIHGGQCALRVGLLGKTGDLQERARDRGRGRGRGYRQRGDQLVDGGRRWRLWRKRLPWRRRRGHRVVLLVRVLTRHQSDHLDPGGAGAVHAQLHRRGVAEVDDAAVVERTAIVDPDHDRAAVGQVGDPRETGQRQRLVRRGEGVHVVHLEVGRAATVELVAVVRGDAGFAIALGAVADVVLLAQHRVRRAVAVTRVRFGDDFRFRDQVHVGNAAGGRAV